jgi:hypothetical protein
VGVDTGFEVAVVLAELVGLDQQEAWVVMNEVALRGLRGWCGGCAIGLGLRGYGGTLMSERVLGGVC